MISKNKCGCFGIVQTIEKNENGSLGTKSVVLCALCNGEILDWGEGYLPPLLQVPEGVQSTSSLKPESSKQSTDLIIENLTRDFFKSSSNDKTNVSQEDLFKKKQKKKGTKKSSKNIINPEEEKSVTSFGSNTSSPSIDLPISLANKALNEQSHENGDSTISSPRTESDDDQQKQQSDQEVNSNSNSIQTNTLPQIPNMNGNHLVNENGNGEKIEEKIQETIKEEPLKQKDSTQGIQVPKKNDQEVKGINVIKSDGPSENGTYGDYFKRYVSKNPAKIGSYSPTQPSYLDRKPRFTESSNLTLEIEKGKQIESQKMNENMEKRDLIDEFDKDQKEGKKLDSIKISGEENFSRGKSDSMISTNNEHFGQTSRLKYLEDYFEVLPNDDAQTAEIKRKLISKMKQKRQNSFQKQEKLNEQQQQQQQLEQQEQEEQQKIESNEKSPFPNIIRSSSNFQVIYY